MKNVLWRMQESVLYWCVSYLKSASSFAPSCCLLKSTAGRTSTVWSAYGCLAQPNRHVALLSSCLRNKRCGGVWGGAQLAFHRDREED